MKIGGISFAYLKFKTTICKYIQWIVKKNKEKQIRFKIYLQ